MSVDLTGLAEESFCYVTTTGRVTGREHTIEIWFALHDRTLYLLSGGGDRSDWVRNLRRASEVSVRLGDVRLAGRARVVTDPQEDELARRLVYEKYRRSYGGDLIGWRRSALPVAVDLPSP
jgi:deazaflavin-dependent oxidoreductase (nitroreductase family)